MWGTGERASEGTDNIQRPTFNVEHPTKRKTRPYVSLCVGLWALDCWTLNVRRSLPLPRQIQAKQPQRVLAEDLSPVRIGDFGVEVHPHGPGGVDEHQVAAE